MMACVAATLTLFGGCASNSIWKAVERRNASVLQTLELSGTEGAEISGYYIVRGEKVPVSGRLPLTISRVGITECKFRKRRLEDTLELRADDGTSRLSLNADPGVAGIAAKLGFGGSVRHL